MVQSLFAERTNNQYFETLIDEGSATSAWPLRGNHVIIVSCRATVVHLRQALSDAIGDLAVPEKVMRQQVMSQETCPCRLDNAFA